jgi:hypothetical protein
MNYKNIEWKSYHGALLPKTAPHIKIDLTNQEQKELLKLSNAYFLRYISNWDMEQESEFWYVIKDSQEDLMSYKGNHRNQIKKGLKNCIVKKVSNNIIANDGYDVYKKAFLNYVTGAILTTKDNFKKSILNSKEYDFWAVFENIEDKTGGVGKMIAYSQNIIESNSVNYSTIKFHPDYLKLYPSYALFFEMNKYYVNEQNFFYVNDGARSILHDTNIQSFLIQKFKFRKAYCKLNVVYRWDVRLIVILLYPFRSLIAKFKGKRVLNKLNTLLVQEDIRRDCNIV